MKFELLPTVTYVWRKKGKVFYVPTPGSNAKIAVCGAFRWPDGPFIFSHGNKGVNSDLFVQVLSMLRIRARRTGRIINLVIDNGPAHTSKHSSQQIQALKEFIDVFWLPKYSSEKLNDIENLWKHIKENYFCKMLVKNRKKFSNSAVKLLNSLGKRGKLRNLIKLPWPKQALGANLVHSA